MVPVPLLWLRKLPVALILVIALCLGPVAQAEPAAPASLTIGLDDRRHPLADRQGQGAWAGLEIDLVRLLAAELGQVPQVAEIPHGAGLAILESGQVDALVTLGPALADPATAPRRVSPAYATLALAVYPLRGAPLDNPDLAVCSLAEQVSAPVLDKLVDWHVLELASVEALLIRMADGDCRSVAVPLGLDVPRSVATGLLLEAGEGLSLDLHLLVRDGDEVTRRRLSTALSTLAARGDLAALAQRWGLASAAPDVRP